MANYAKINFQQIDNISQTEGNEVRFARKFLNSSELGVSRFKYAPGYQATTAHSHKVQEEVYVVVEGAGEMLLDDETIAIVQWDVVRVAPAVVRAFAAGDDGLTIIAIGGQKPAEGDGVRAEAAWPKQT